MRACNISKKCEQQFSKMYMSVTSATSQMPINNQVTSLKHKIESALDTSSQKLYASIPTRLGAAAHYHLKNFLDTKHHHYTLGSSCMVHCQEQGRGLCSKAAWYSQHWD